MTEKGSQLEEGRDAVAHVVPGEPRSVGGPATGSQAEPRTAPPSTSETEPEPQSSDEPTAEELPSKGEPVDASAPSIAASESLDPETAPMAADATTAQSFLSPVFEQPSAQEPGAGPAEVPQPTDFDSATIPQTEQKAAEPAPPPFTSAAYDLFFPPPADAEPTYQTRGHTPYGRVPISSGDEIAPPASSLSDFESRKARAIELFWIGARYAGYGLAGYLAFVLVLILLFRFVNPPASSLMLWQWMTGNSVDRTWVPIQNMSPNLIRAVVVAEDGRFCDHAGIDLQAMGEAIRNATDGTPRGASTISMQVTKNMFLWSSKSYIRKIIELPLTLIMEIVWPKRRILEVYLNIAEWGPGIFGAEAASRYHFRQSAARLGERQAALLAATLPNPIVRDAGDPSTLVSRKARVIQARMRAAGPNAAACVLNRR